MKFKTFLKKTWNFIWKEDSVLSWVVNIIIAFLLVKFIIYPGLGLLLGTTYPVVAVVSGSMEHQGNFEEWWENNEGWYIASNITKEQMSDFRFRNGFDKGDIMVLNGVDPGDVEIGDVVVYSSNEYNYPIIHRVTYEWEENNKYYFETKGDNNKIADMRRVSEDQVIGKAVFRIKWLGWIKIFFTDTISYIARGFY